MNFRAKKITRGTLQNDKTIHAPEKHNNPKCVHTKQQNFKYVKQKLIEPKREIDKYTITVGDFHMYSATDKTTGQEISKMAKM